jgi:hypothetical protein
MTRGGADEEDRIYGARDGRGAEQALDRVAFQPLRRVMGGDDGRPGLAGEAKQWLKGKKHPPVVVDLGYVKKIDEQVDHDQNRTLDLD